MSYLDKPITRESYFEHIGTKSQSHRNISKVALDWFDKFCIGQFGGKTVKTILSDSLKQKYEDPQRHSKNMFSMLQDFINYLGVEGRDPSTIREYFNLVKKYLNWYGFEIYSESVKSRLNFPQKIEEEEYPLAVEDIKKILNGASPSRRVLYLFLSSTGMRIQETLKLRKRDLDFNFDRVMVRIPGKYTKTKKPRKTFITKETLSYLEPILKKKKDDDLIFAVNEDSQKAKHLEETYFHQLRDRVGLVDRYDNGIHKITLHSFRSWFITKCNRVDSDFGNSLGGHDKYMKKYNRFTDSEKCELFIKADPTLSIFENINSSEQSQKIQELEEKEKENQQSIKNQMNKMNEMAQELEELKYGPIGRRNKYNQNYVNAPVPPEMKILTMGIPILLELLFPEEKKQDMMKEFEKADLENRKPDLHKIFGSRQMDEDNIRFLKKFLNEHQNKKDSSKPTNYVKPRLRIENLKAMLPNHN